MTGLLKQPFLADGVTHTTTTTIMPLLLSKPSLCGCVLVVFQLREELSNARGINELTADETTKLLLDNSRLQQVNAALQSDVLHKNEMLRLLTNQLK